MVASYTGDLRLTKQGDNDNPSTWGDIVNNEVIELIEEAIAGEEVKDITGSSNITLASANGTSDESRPMALKLTGTIGTDIDVLVPSVNKMYIVRAEHTGGTVTVKISGGSGVAFTNGTKAIIYCDGTNVEKIADVTSEFTLEGTAITGQDAGTIADADEILFSDNDDSGNLKRETFEDLKNAILAEVAPSTPSGAVVAFATSSAPANWLACDGSAVSRTTYSDLFTAIGTTFGNGDGSTTFNLPNLQDEFVRGASSTRDVGDSESWAIENIVGFFTGRGSTFGIFDDFASGPFTATDVLSNGPAQLGPLGGSFDKIVFDASDAVQTSTETRPRNVALLYCIKT